MDSRIRQYLFGLIFFGFGVYEFKKNDPLEASVYLLAGLAFIFNNLVSEPSLLAYKKLLVTITWTLIIAASISISLRFTVQVLITVYIKSAGIVDDLRNFAAIYQWLINTEYTGHCRLEGGCCMLSFKSFGAYLALGSVTPRRVIFFLVEALLCLVITNWFRIFLNRYKWLYMPMHKLIPRVFVSVFVMGLLIYFLRLPVTFVLGKLFDPDTTINLTQALTINQILGSSLSYAFLFFLWTVFYFIYHYFERYNTSLKYDASMIEIELNNLKSQLNPHFIFNALNSIRALVDENPSKSKQAINQLIQYFKKLSGLR